MKKEQKAVPVAVSHITPLYVDGRIEFWRVDVTYTGDLATNTNQIKEWCDIYKKTPELFETHPGLYNMMSPIFVSGLSIPNLKYAHIFNYDAKSDKTMLGYVWKDGLLGRGAEHAWQFRLEILKEIMNNKINTKAK